MISTATAPNTANPRRAEIKGSIQIPAAFAREVQATTKTTVQLKTRVDGVDHTNITPLLHTLLVSALFLDASDIHLEPEKQETKLRLRIDGILQDVTLFSPQIHKVLLSRIKLVSGAKLNVSKRPQDGRFSFIIGNSTPIEVRVSTLPSEYGEAAVLRVLNPQNLIALKDLGVRKDLLALFIKTLKKPNGMIVATGPTGSGKTTTLYAFLRAVQKPEIKIVTIEDPIEYHLEGVSQTQVDSTPQKVKADGTKERRYDFATGLQAIMRQDPDVILVGEIRDKSTAQIALQAALTGHLVLSTLHTNDAPGTVSRLLSLKASPVNIAAALNVVVGQRLVRKVCSKCAILEPAQPQEFREIKAGLQNIVPVLDIKLPEILKLARPKGCVRCNMTGYKGRIGIFEAIEISDEIEEFIATSPPTSALRSYAIKKGMTTMYQDGLLKVIQGITTLQEIARVATE